MPLVPRTTRKAFRLGNPVLLHGVWSLRRPDLAQFNGEAIAKSSGRAPYCGFISPSALLACGTGKINIVISRGRLRHFQTGTRDGPTEVKGTQSCAIAKQMISLSFPISSLFSDYRTPQISLSSTPGEQGPNKAPCDTHRLIGPGACDDPRRLGPGSAGNHPRARMRNGSRAPNPRSSHQIRKSI